MNHDPPVTIQLNPDDAAVNRLRDRLIAFNRSRVPEPNYLPFLLSISDERDELVGGLSGYMYHSWLFVELLWVGKEARGQGFGTKLLLHAEEQARQHGCHSVWLDTFSFQARGFYEKQGYAVFGELPNYPGEHCRYFLSKKLA